MSEEPKEESYLEKCVRTEPGFGRAMNIESALGDAEEAMWRRLRQYNWGFKSLSKRLGIKRRAAKRLMKKEEKSFRSVVALCDALDLQVIVVPRRDRYSNLGNSNDV